VAAVLSVILLARAAASEVALAMAALVPGSVDGFIHQLVVAAPDGAADLAALCEDAGATLVRGGLAEGVAAARREVLLGLPAELRWPEDGLRRLNQALTRGARSGLVRGEGEGGLLGAFQARPYGVLAPRTDFAAAAAGGLTGVRRRLGGRAVRLV
jgi:hypothetical protein